ncbi:thioesterase [Actinomadura graeca]|uniref:Thioesterase n=1 Tax=Actinomadura graeca TaxID=2750812 RepID=A0ABX8QSL3_9ACTN|nr:alpha/beta fold hydrolase [Actinomadura graeca]QXJ21816.1 thioesterase [Actinomadura graeca]
MEARGTTDAVREPRDGRRARRPLGGNRQEWLLCPRPDPEASLRLLCLPYAGGRAGGLLGLADGLPAGVEMGVVELPGHGGRLREVPFTRLRPLVAHLAGRLAGRLDKPYVLLGYSMGALLAFEVAHELARRGLPGPRALFVAAFEAPHLPPARPPMHDLPRAGLLARLARYDNAAAAVLGNEELAGIMLPIVRADMAVCETYEHRPRPPLDVPVAAFGGDADATVSRDGLEAWRELTRGGFSVTHVPGGHFFLDSARDVFVKGLRAELARLTDSRE